MELLTFLTDLIVKVLYVQSLVWCGGAIRNGGQRLWFAEPIDLASLLGRRQNSYISRRAVVLRIHYDVMMVVMSWGRWKR